MNTMNTFFTQIAAIEGAPLLVGERSDTENAPQRAAAHALLVMQPRGFTFTTDDVQRLWGPDAPPGWAVREEAKKLHDKGIVKLVNNSETNVNTITKL